MSGIKFASFNGHEYIDVITTDEHILVWLMLASLVGSMFSIFRHNQKASIFKTVIDVFLGLILGTFLGLHALDLEFSNTLSILCSLMAGVFGSQVLDIIISLIPAIIMQLIKNLVKKYLKIDLNIGKNNNDKQ